ncbi:hypothetical protein HanRHA438_Chr16g0758521 [Helianthus annuus]|nr:hypothetical protein HanRHA438_Chr16g0758521 [Helianthus annuus]
MNSLFDFFQNELLASFSELVPETNLVFGLEIFSFLEFSAGMKPNPFFLKLPLWFGFF